jgi:hypothetical protein
VLARLAEQKPQLLQALAKRIFRRHSEIASGVARYQLLANPRHHEVDVPHAPPTRLPVFSLAAVQSEPPVPEPP